MATTAPAPPRSQASRSAEMKARLLEAAIECLVEHGYAFTTAVEICARAGVSRGAYNHHYASAEALFADVIERLYVELAEGAPNADAPETLEALIRAGWSRARHPRFKAVIELWLASRNDPTLGAAVRPKIDRLSHLFDPANHPVVANALASDPSLATLYRMAMETMIGLALGRATSPEDRPVEHEEPVIELLLALARERGAS